MYFWVIIFVIFCRTFCLIKPDIVHKSGEIIKFMQDNGFKIIQLKMGQMSQECASNFYVEHKNETYLVWVKIPFFN